MKDHEHDWSEPPAYVYCSDATCDVTLEEYLAKLYAENAALREMAQAVADVGLDAHGYCPACTLLVSEIGHTDRCPVALARALLADAPKEN